MSNALTHKFASLRADSNAAGVVQPSHWNAEHLFSGGADGDVVAALGSSSDGAEWVDRFRLVIARQRHGLTARWGMAPTTTRPAFKQPSGCSRDSGVVHPDVIVSPDFGGGHSDAIYLVTRPH